MAHYLFSQELDIMIEAFDKFNKDSIKKTIVEHLKQNPKDTVEHCKDFKGSDIRKYYGHEIINLYEVNQRNGKVSKVITKDNKTVYSSIEN